MLQISHLIGMDRKALGKVGGLAKGRRKNQKSSRSLHVCALLCRVSYAIQVISRSCLF